MKLGKALATGVAEERPEIRHEGHEDLEPPESIAEFTEVTEEKAPEEVPAAR
ncbi:hypothetical protein ACIRU8_34280 [Streptomyces sp. NPDC101175]|uniref:hypothetical protein n=1 Tax=Streptomyces sp. NPDC101175 TaxID=3366123 RepID=UPI003832FCB1